MINVLSLFDGMSCGQIALKDLGYSVNKYYSSEIDKHAIKQTQLNFPETVQFGNVEDWQNWPVKWESIDLILAGSPCQGFSYAGKQLAFDDPRSRLFFIFVDILNHIKKVNPKVKFLLENVDMKRSSLKIISEYCGLFPVNINSNLVSAQSRNRWYWTNIRTVRLGLFSDLYSDIPLPKDRLIFVKDVLENEVDEKYYISDLVFKRLTRRNYSLPKINPKKAGSLSTKNNSGSMSLDSGTTFICAAMRGRNPDNPSSRKAGLLTEQRLELNTLGKTNCLTSVSKDNLIIHNLMPRSSKNGNGGSGPLSKQDGKTYCLQMQEKNVVEINQRLRRLTPLECSRLQTIPDWYKWACSDTQIYKMLGNGWTIEVIKHILSFLKIN